MPNELGYSFVCNYGGSEHPSSEAFKLSKIDSLNNEYP